MKLNSEELKKLYQQKTARSARPDAECPSPEMLIETASGELSRPERERVVDHMVACSDCAHEYRLIRSRSAALSSHPAISRRQVAAIAALLLVAFAVGLALWRMSAPGYNPTENIRGSGGLVERVEPPDGAQLDEAPRELSWSAVESAEEYQVALYDSASTPIWESGPVSETSIPLPERVRQNLKRGEPLYWRVIARRGIDRRRSELFRFMIRAN